MALNRLGAVRARAVGRRWLGLALAIIASAAGMATPTHRIAAQTSPSEYQLKAVFLFNFAQFTEWPDSTFPSPTAPLVIGVLGKDPFGVALDETVRGETLNGHPLVVQRYAKLEDIQTCHILFVGRPERGNVDSILGKLQHRPILTVGDVDQFARHGGMLQFVIDRSRVRLRANPDAVTTAHLKVSSKLLRSAEIVTTGKDE